MKHDTLKEIAVYGMADKDTHWRNLQVFQTTEAREAYDFAGSSMTDDKLSRVEIHLDGIPVKGWTRLPDGQSVEYDCLPHDNVERGIFSSPFLSALGQGPAVSGLQT